VTATQIWTAIQNLRMDASILTTDGGIKNWVSAREGEVWQYADWPQKNMANLNLSVVGGTATVALPTGMTWTSQSLQVFDNYGNELLFMEPDNFYRFFYAAASSPLPSGTPAAWTLTTDTSAGATLQIRVGPTPVASATFTIRGWALPISRSAATVYQAGVMSAGTDLPWWPDAYHYFLVDGALATGKRQLGDPSWQQDEAAFQSGLQRLRSELIPAARTELVQWGS
jgi:hypothetical protein